MTLRDLALILETPLGTSQRYKDTPLVTKHRKRICAMYDTLKDSSSFTEASLMARECWLSEMSINVPEE